MVIPIWQRTWIPLILTIIIATGVIFSESFRDDDFSRYDSAFYTTIAQNILRTKDWINLKYHEGTPFEADHPPLTFWLTALSLKLFGESVFSAVLLSLVSAVATCVIVFFIGTILKNNTVGFLSSMGLLLTRYVPRVARHNTIEIPLMFFISLAVLTLILSHKKHRAFYLLFGLSTGLAILSKGVVGLFPLGLCIVMILFQKRLRDLYNPFFLGGLILCFAIPGTWLFLKGNMSIAGMYKVLHQYLEFVFSTMRASKRPDPGSRIRFIIKLFEFSFLIIPCAFIGTYLTLRDYIKKNNRYLIIIPLWAVIFTAAYCASSWRRGFYLLPMYPSLAILFGIGLEKIIPKNYRIYSIGLITVFFLGNITAPFLFPHWEPKSVGEVLYRNTYLAKARKAVKALYNQCPNLKFVGYQQHSQGEFLFFFGTDHKLDFTRNTNRFSKLVNGQEAVLFYISKEEFSKIDKPLHKKLKIVYFFANQLLVTNQTNLVPVFNSE